MMWASIWAAQSLCCAAGLVLFLMSIYGWMKRRVRFRFCVLTGVLEFVVLPAVFLLTIVVAKGHSNG